MKNLVLISTIIVLGVIIFILSIVTYGTIPGTNNSTSESETINGNYSYGTDSDYDDNYSSKNEYSSNSSSIVGTWYGSFSENDTIVTFEKDGTAILTIVSTQYVHPTPVSCEYKYTINGDHLTMTIADSKNQRDFPGYDEGDFKIDGNQLIFENSVLERVASYEDALDLVEKNSDKVESIWD